MHQADDCRAEQENKAQQSQGALDGTMGPRIGVEPTCDGDHGGRSCCMLVFHPASEGLSQPNAYPRHREGIKTNYEPFEGIACALFEGEPLRHRHPAGDGATQKKSEKSSARRQWPSE